MTATPPKPSPPAWISVEERLPDYQDRVLLWLVTVDPINSAAVIGQRSFYEKGKFWDGSTYRPWEWISHWMPLPEPPAGMAVKIASGYDHTPASAYPARYVASEEKP